LLPAILCAIPLAPRVTQTLPGAQKTTLSGKRGGFWRKGYGNFNNQELQDGWEIPDQPEFPGEAWVEALGAEFDILQAEWEAKQHDEETADVDGTFQAHAGEWHQNPALDLTTEAVGARAWSGARFAEYARRCAAVRPQRTPPIPSPTPSCPDPPPSPPPPPLPTAALTPPAPDLCAQENKTVYVPGEESYLKGAPRHWVEGDADPDRDHKSGSFRA
jgi:hypothetical protein